MFLSSIFYFNFHTDIYLSLKRKATVLPWHLQKASTHSSIHQLIRSALWGPHCIRYCALHRHTGYRNCSRSMNSVDLSSNLRFFLSCSFGLARVRHLTLWFSSFLQIPCLSRETPSSSCPVQNLRNYSFSSFNPLPKVLSIPPSDAWFNSSISLCH